MAMLGPDSPFLRFDGLARQALAAGLMGRLVGWRKGGAWLARRAVGTIPVAAGAAGMGCIGFPYHPVWEVTGACNLRCVHCHAASGRPGPDELTTKEGFALIDQLAAERRFGMLVFTGGEPLVRPDLPDLLAHSRDRGLVNVIATNGTLIDRRLARRLRALNVRGVAVSLDHTDPARHNAIRGDGDAFGRALAGLEACRAAGIVTQVNFTAMPANLDNVEQMLALCERLGTSIVLCYQVVPMGRGEGISALTAAGSAELMRRIAAAQAHVTTVVEPVAAPQYWAHLLAGPRGGGGLLHRLARWAFHGCVAGWGLVYIKPDGEVWPCPFVPVSGGNVRSRPFGEIWREGEIFRLLRDRANLTGRCGACEHRAICGGCRGKAFAACGDALAEDPCCFLSDPAGPPAAAVGRAEGSNAT